MAADCRASSSPPSCVYMPAVLMIASGAFGALTVGNVKWVWWFFGMCWFLHIIFALGKSWAEAAKAKGGESGSVYSKIAGITVITWFCYPIVWVFAEGFGNFSVTFEVSLVCVTDTTDKPALLMPCVLPSYSLLPPPSSLLPIPPQMMASAPRGRWRV